MRCFFFEWTNDNLAIATLVSIILETVYAIALEILIIIFTCRVKADVYQEFATFYEISGEDAKSVLHELWSSGLSISLLNVIVIICCFFGYFGLMRRNTAYLSIFIFGLVIDLITLSMINKILESKYFQINSMVFDAPLVVIKIFFVIFTMGQTHVVMIENKTELYDLGQS